AWEEGDALKVDVCASNATQFAPRLDGSMASPAEGLQPTLRRWTLDLGGERRAVHEEIIDGDVTCEFPRTDDRYMTRAYRHAYLVGSKDAAMVFNRLLHYDRHSGARYTWGDGSYLLGEPVLAPRGDAAGEGDGYLLNLAYNRSSGLSELLVFDAQGIADGPLARVMMPLRIPAGFHGSWVAA
ncbi:MAG: carotenoid oxygenase family protein, partial [Halioglobus sp.]|nr:carotenoid oxygenase family protein [Halioglobus sp.]